MIQIRRFTHAVSILSSSRKTQKGSISSFQAFCISIAARVGTGNLAGVAIALSLGGPGAVFWMWLLAFFGMSTSFVECTLAQLYKVKNKDGTFRGGPAYYMRYGLGKKWVGTTFSVLLLSTMGFAFNAVQANSIASAVHTAFDVSSFTTAFSLTLLTALVILKGVPFIAKISEMIVPVMALLYLLIITYVLTQHIADIPSMFSIVLKSAFGIEQAGAGLAGYTFAAAISNGVRRGLFSNEAGMGSTPNAAATSSPYPNHPITQGYLAMLGVFIDTMMICTSTAALILFSGALQDSGGASGIELTQLAATKELGPFGTYFIAIVILLFASTTIIGNYAFGESNLRFLFDHRQKENKLILYVYRLSVLFMIFWGSIASLPSVWSVADLFLALMTLMNISTILALSKEVFKINDQLEEQISSGKEPSFSAKDFPDIEKSIPDGCW